MLNIQFIRDNPQLVAEKSKQKGYKVDVKKLLELDDKRRELTPKVENLRGERRKLAQTSKGSKPDEVQIKRGQEIKDQLNPLSDELEAVEAEFNTLLKTVPNMPADDVPVGASEDDNHVASQWGDKPKFSFKPKTHWQIAEERQLIDKARAAKVAGSRFAYIKGDLVRLQMAIIQYVLDVLTDKEAIKKIIQEYKIEGASSKPFTPILPPAMLRTDVYEAMDRLEPREERYKVGQDDDNLWLQGSAEHTIGPMYINEILPLEKLPIRYVGYLTSFRREAGSYGKDAEGIIRMHQFDKLEMESFVNPEGGEIEHKLFVAIQEYLMRSIGIHYRVIQKCTADIGKPNARGIDIDAWMPGADTYRETHTADYMTDYQARRLGTKTKAINSGGEHNSDKQPTNFVHTNDATAFALGRTMAAIIENYQTAEGKIKIPEILRPYMRGQEII